ncbi:MAG: ankyrin repeat domain-containing protein [Burkholderiales bacterium]
MDAFKPSLYSRMRLLLPALLLSLTSAAHAQLRELDRALISAASKGETAEIVRLLVAYGANPSLADRDGVTPLQHARRRGYATIASTLERAGAR